MHQDGSRILVQLWFCQGINAIASWLPLPLRTANKTKRNISSMIDCASDLLLHKVTEGKHSPHSVLLSCLLRSRRTRLLCFLSLVLLWNNSLKFSRSEMYLKVKVTTHSVRMSLKVQFSACPHQDTHKCKIASFTSEMECLELTKGQI